MSWIVELRGELGNLIPGGMLRHGEMMLSKDVFVVHQEAALGVERNRIRVILIGQRGHDGFEQVAVVVAALVGRRHFVEVGLQVLQPAVVCPNRRLIIANGGDVELARIGGDILRHFGA